MPNHNSTSVVLKTDNAAPVTIPIIVTTLREGDSIQGTSLPHSSIDAGMMMMHRLGKLAGCRYEQALSGAVEQRPPVQVFTSFVARSYVLREGVRYASSRGMLSSAIDHARPRFVRRTICIAHPHTTRDSSDIQRTAGAAGIGFTQVVAGNDHTCGLADSAMVIAGIGTTTPTWRRQDGPLPPVRPSRWIVCILAHC